MDKKTIVSFILFIAGILGFIYFKIGFVLGFIIGSSTIAIIFLFPSNFALLILDKVFDYSNKTSKVMQNETEKRFNKNRVKYNS